MVAMHVTACSKTVTKGDWSSATSRVNMTSKYGANTSEVPMILCANKTDKKGRVVSEEEGYTYASNRGMKYFDVSAQSGMNVEEMFNDLFSDVVRRSYH